MDLGKQLDEVLARLSRIETLLIEQGAERGKETNTESCTEEDSGAEEDYTDPRQYEQPNEEELRWQELCQERKRCETSWDWEKFRRKVKSYSLWVYHNKEALGKEEVCCCADPSTCTVTIQEEDSQDSGAEEHDWDQTLKDLGQYLF